MQSCQKTIVPCHTIICILRTYTFTTRCTQFASTALMGSSPMCTTSKPTTTNPCMSVTTQRAQLRKEERKPVTWSTEQSWHTQSGNTHAVRSSRTQAKVTIVFGHNRFLKHAFAQLDDNTLVKRKKRLSQTKKTRKITKMSLAKCMGCHRYILVQYIIMVTTLPHQSTCNASSQNLECSKCRNRALVNQKTSRRVATTMNKP